MSGSLWFTELSKFLPGLVFSQLRKKHVASRDHLVLAGLTSSHLASNLCLLLLNQKGTHEGSAWITNLWPRRKAKKRAYNPRYFPSQRSHWWHGHSLIMLKLEDQAEYLEIREERQDAFPQGYQFHNIYSQEEKVTSHLKDKVRVQTRNAIPNNSTKEKHLGKNSLQMYRFRFGKQRQGNWQQDLERSAGTEKETEDHLDHIGHQWVEDLSRAFPCRQQDMCRGRAGPFKETV